MLLEMVQTDSNLFKRRFSNLEKETANLAHKTQSMTVGAETLFERIPTVESLNQTLSKGNDRLTDRMSLQEGNMHAMKIMSKDETLFLLDRFYTLESSMRALEQNTGQEIQTLQKAVVKRFKKIGEFMKFDDHGQKVQRQKCSLISMYQTLG